MHIVGRSPQKANESALECNALQLTVHNGLIYEISLEIKSDKVSVVGEKNFKTEHTAWISIWMTERQAISSDAF